MNESEFSEIIEQLRQRIDDVEASGDEDLSDRMRSVRGDLRRWDKAGREGLLPHAPQLLAWGIPVDNHVVATADADGPVAAALDGDAPLVETPDEPEAAEEAVDVSDADADDAAEPTPPPTADVYDPDDALQGDYDAAQRSLSDRRYRAALNAFDELRLVASGRLVALSEKGYERAAAQLAQQVRAPIGRAQNHARKQPQDINGQHRLWQAVLEVDPEDETALAALHALEEQERERETQDEAPRQPVVNRAVFTADDPVATYRLAQKYLDEAVPVVFDENGVFGPVGTEYDPASFFKLARENLLHWSREKALERRRVAAQEAPTASRRALSTLQEGVAFLDNDLFTLEDRETLQETLDLLNKDIAELQESIVRFDKAQKLVTEADLAPPRDRLRLLRQARAAYPDYPNLTALMTRAEEAVAGLVAHALADRLTHARDLLDQREFVAALESLAAARAAAYNEVPHPAPDSPLDEQLRALEALEEEIQAAQQNKAWDPDDDLQVQYDTAQTYLNNQRYRAALNAFAELRQLASGRLEGPSDQGYETAAVRLAEQVRAPIERAQNHARKQAQDIKGQRRLWEAVLTIDPEDETALAALRALNEREAERDTQRQIADMRNRLGPSKERKNHPGIVKLLGEAEALAVSNTLPSLQPELDNLVRDIKRSRDEVRADLGMASTRAASDDYVGAYRLAQDYLDQNVPVAFDEQGVFGPVNAEYDPVAFLKLARENLLRWSRDKAVERRQTAAQEAPTAPRRALLTLQEGVAFLENDLFRQEDIDALQETLDRLNKDIAEVQERITRFEAAEKLVNAADMAPPRERLGLLKQTRAAYADYPNIAGLLERAEEAVAAVVAGELQNEMVRARQKQDMGREGQPPLDLEPTEWKLEQHAQWANEQFQAALDLLAAARARATEEVTPKPDSTLDRQMQAVAAQEVRITTDQKEYNTMVAKLERIDKLLRAHETNAPAHVLSNARAELDKLTNSERGHYLALARYTRLADLQDVRESWSQGRDAYAIGNWAGAIPLLTRAAGSNIPEHQDAMQMMKRATAARTVVEAREAQVKGEWKEALTKYRLADKAFKEWPTSDAIDPAAPYNREAENELKQLAEVEANDEEVQTAISKASDWLDKAEELIPKRKVSGIATDRVEPIDNFAQALAVIKVVNSKNLRTNKGAELESVQARARRLWRETYIDGIHFALQKQDEELLRRAVALGRTLESNSLLIEASDKDAYRQARELYFDLELDRLRRKPPRLADMRAELAELEAQKGDSERIERLRRDIALLQQEPIHASALIAQNRKERLLAAEVETDELREQYHQAAAARVRYQLEVELRNGPAAALEFLSRELETPELYQNEAFFAELMHLCWQTNKWSQAYDRARGLASRARLEQAGLKSELWHGLTAMANYLSHGEQTRFDAELAATKEKAQRYPELLPFVEEQRRWQIVWRIDTLVAEAEQVARTAKGTPWLRAIELYAAAYALSPADQRIRAGLQTIGAPLTQNLTSRIQAAQQMTLHGPLKASVDKANAELDTLKTIRTVAEPLGLHQDDRQDLATAIGKLEGKLGPWKTALAKVEAAQRKIDESLRSPRSFQGEDDGGWQFGEARQLLEEAQKEARADRDLMRNIQDVVDELEELENRAEDLNSLVYDFREAALEEKFDEAIQAAQQLNALWAKRRESDGFEGLNDLIKVSYPQVKKPPKGLAEHIKLAQEQKRNLQEWADWAERVKRVYDDVKRQGDEQRADLKSLKQRKALAPICDDCDAIIKLSGQFANALATSPQDEPKSAKALAEQKRITQTMIADVGDTYSGYLGRAKTLRLEAEKELHDLESNQLAKLRTAIDRLEKEAQKVGRKPSLFAPRIEYIAENHFKTAENYLAECQKIDPNNPDVKRLLDRFKSFADKRAARK